LEIIIDFPFGFPINNISSQERGRGREGDRREGKREAGRQGGREERGRERLKTTENLR